MKRYINCIMNIKHLIIPSGGSAGFITYGALRQLAKKGVWNIKKIKSIYGSSIGAFIGAVILLDYKWEWLDDFFYKRPWSDVVKINPGGAFWRWILHVCLIVKFEDHLFL